LSPGIVLVCDPHSARAQGDVAGMLRALGVTQRAGGPDGHMVAAGTGEGWAVAAIPPPASEPTCGACIYTDGQDILIWAGEMFLPETWRAGVETPTPQEAIGAAVLRRLQALGVEVLAEVDGAFCGAWYDRSHGRWAIFNDKLGLIPVFYAGQEDRLVVAPKAWLAWQATGEPLNVSELGVVDLLRCENMVDEHTLIKGVRWLRAGHVLIRSEQGLRSCRYSDFHYRGKSGSTQDELIDGYVDALQRTMQRHAVAEAPLRLGISGGLDSRVFLGMCQRIGHTPACFTAGWAFGDDVRFGRRLARAARAPHEWVPLKEHSLPDRLVDAIVETDGLHGAGHLAPATAMRAHLRELAGSVLLEGYMQGVLGGAYVPADEQIASAAPAHQSAWARRRLHAGGDAELINGLLLPELAMESFRRWQQRVDDGYRRAPTRDPLERAEYTIASGRSGRIDVLGTALLRRDVLVRNPACDRIMLDWHATAPVRLRRGKRIYVEVVRRCFPRLARVQRTASSGLPIAESRWLREYFWQREKLHRWWAGLRYPWTRTWGTGGHAIRAWTLETWRSGGGLDVLTEPNARVLNWVERRPLLALWDQATRDPPVAGPLLDRASPLLNLATIETMVRWLERLPAGMSPARADRVRFRSFVPVRSGQTDKTARLVRSP